jgi:hypothetical protein
MDVPLLGRREGRGTGCAQSQSETRMCREQTQKQQRRCPGGRRVYEMNFFDPLFGTGWETNAGSIRHEIRKSPNRDSNLSGQRPTHLLLLFDFCITIRNNLDSGVTPFHQWCNRHKAEKQRRRRVGGVMLASLAQAGNT